MIPVVRPALSDDARDVAAIYVESWNSGFAGLMPARTLTDELVAAWARNLTEAPPYRWWVAEIDAKVAGFAGICPSRDPVDSGLGELDTIAVHPSRWRSGVGRALMAVVIKHLIVDGYQEAILWTVAGYERGLAFYASTGWRRDGGTRDDARQVRLRHLLHTN
ncbi:MAG: GNAT family N-acetyltransferase [Actinomycetota bacterium]|nr:GNAT family N-acetyltransferase [Actinomycetota bacterium]